MPRTRSTPFVLGNKLSVGNKSHLGQYDVWRPELCEEILPLAEQGKGVVQICATLGFSRNSWQVWQEKHPEWSVAVSRATELAEQWWLDYAQQHMLTSSDFRFNDKVWALNMMNRFGWNKKEETTVKGELADAMKAMYDRLNDKKSDPRTVPRADSPKT